MNFTSDTITPVRDLVMVVQDLYLPRELRGSAAALPDLPGFEQLARFGRHARLPRGWREQLLHSAGRMDLEGVAPVCIAAAGLRTARVAESVDGEQPAARWIATPLHLRAHLRGVFLDQRGLLRLTEAEQAQLSAEFARSFPASACALLPLPSGEFLLDTPGIAPLATPEPARYAGCELDELMPAGPAAVPLRRLLGEIEMWLHALPLNEARRQRGAAPVSALWPWGASGRIVCPAPEPARRLPLACGRDAWLEGLWRLQGSAVQSAPQRLEELLAAGVQAGVLLVELGGELREDSDTTADALRRIDERLVSPALAALRRGTLERLSLIVNDVCVRIQRASLRRFWRRPRRGLAGFV
ncbi:MAG: hypothetical protein JO158_07690 [Gammaproteobacteria bacterium]|nr:hypothetical protein [Gammaproteobacteria bacterium]MBV9724691.1 hypothetical protein [Gammaproteobacteria bacterium]